MHRSRFARHGLLYSTLGAGRTPCGMISPRAKPMSTQLQWRLTRVGLRRLRGARYSVLTGSGWRRRRWNYGNKSYLGIWISLTQTFSKVEYFRVPYCYFCKRFFMRKIKATYKVTNYNTWPNKLTSKHLVQTSIKFYYVLYNVTTGYLLHEKFPKGLIFCFWRLGLLF